MPPKIANRRRDRRSRAVGAVVESLEPRELFALYQNDIDSLNLGKGMWAWTLTGSTGAMARDGFSTSDFDGWFNFLKNTQGLDYVIIKAGGAESPLSQYNTNLVNKAHQYGLKIFPYFYIYGDNVAGEINCFNNVMDNIGGDAAIIDIEGEYGGGAAEAAKLTQYFQGIGRTSADYGTGTGSRDKLFMAYSTFDNPRVHQGQTPFAVCADYMDAAMPQMYWKAHGYSISQDITIVDQDYKNTGAGYMGNTAGIKPVIPTGQAYDQGNGQLTIAETNAFFNAIVADTNAVGPGGVAGFRYKSINWFDERALDRDVNGNFVNGATTTYRPQREALAAHQIGDLPGVATLQSPANGASGLSPSNVTLNWSDVVNTFGTGSVGAALYYDVYLDNMATPVTTISYTAPTAPVSQWTIPGTLGAGQHSWKIVSRNMFGSTSSAVQTFTVNALQPPGVPSGPNHNGNIVNAKPVLLDWADATDATSYDVYLGTNLTPTYVDLAVSQVSLTSPAEGLRLWRVVAKNALGTASGPQWSYTMDSVAPTAAYGSQTPTQHTGYLDFTITFADDTTAVDVASLDNSDITVTGPNGFSGNATLLGVDVNTNGSPRVATYRLAAPGGTWGVSDNGTYTVSQNATQVRDIGNTYRAAGSISTFSVNFSALLPGTPSNPSHHNIATNVKPLVLNWDDVPFATSYDVYLGAAVTPTYADLTVSQTPSISPADGLRLWRVVAKNADGATTGPQWSYTMDTVVPTASLGGQTPANGATFDFTLTYADAGSGVDSATFDNNDVAVTGPGGYAANATFISNAGNVATYRITGPGGAWDSADNGTYTVSVNGAQVKDLANNSVAAGSVGTFNANLSAPAFAWMTGSTLNVQFDGTTTPITLATLSGDITATRDAVTLNFSGVADINVIGTASNDSLQLAGAVAPPLTFSNGNGQDSVEVTTGSYAFASNIGGALKNVAVTVASGASATFNATQHLRGLTVAGDATLSSGGEKVLVTGALAITGQLDLTDNDLVVDYSSTSPIGTWSGSSYDGVTGLIASGRNGGGWDGVGIVSSLADLGGYTTLAVASAADVLGIGPSDTALFGNVTVDGTSVLVKYTYGGDANLSGSVDVDDYGQIDFNASTGGVLTGFLNGDFDYNGLQDVDDYGLIDFVVNIQGAPL